MVIGYLIEVSHSIYTKSTDGLLLSIINFNKAIDTHIGIFPEDIKKRLHNFPNKTISYAKKAG